MASADVAKGAKVFKKCSACHKLEDGANSTGPYLYGVVGRRHRCCFGLRLLRRSDRPGGQSLDRRRAGRLLAKPSAYASGTTMSFSGLKKQKDRVNLIAYLDSLDN